jgi:hypothetical protein
MRFDSYLQELCQEFSEVALLVISVHLGDSDRKKLTKDYAKRKAKIQRLFVEECEDKPMSFSVFQVRIEEFFLMFDAFVADPDNASKAIDVVDTGDLIVDDLWDVQDKRFDAGLLEWEESKDGFSQDGRTFRWLGKNYVLNLNPSKVVKVLFDAYMQGQSWLHQDYIKTESEIQTDLRHLVRDNQLEELIVKQKEKDGKSIRGMWGLNRK